MECAQPLRAAPPLERAPRDYTPRHLAEKILTQRSAVEGERKQVTVLFADVQGSMGLAEQVDPEEWHAILDGFFRILAEAVHRFEGTINQYTGDGIMALFGAPLALEDHAQRACFAALYLREALREYAEELRRTRGLGFSVRTGLSSGEVVVGKIGDDLRMDYTAQGHTVGLAARIQQLAAPGSVYLTDSTAALVSGYCTLRDMGPFELKGVREPVRVFELEGADPLRSRLDLARARGLSAFVSRTAELERLDAALLRAAAGSATRVSVVGEPGVGKSRLCFEFAERCRARGLPVLETRSLPHGEGASASPVRRLLRGALGVEPEQSDEQARIQISGSVLRGDPSLVDALPVVLDFLGVPDPDAPPPELEPDALQRLLIRFVVLALGALRREGPLVVLWEDLHWNDDSADALLGSLCDALADTPTLLLLNFRPEYGPPFGPELAAEEIALAPLGPEASDALLRALLGEHESVRALHQRIRERTAGNPFFIEEVVHALAQSGDLEGERGAYRARVGGAALVIPAGVRDLLAARIDRLDDTAKRALQTAAVVGERFAAPLLAGVLVKTEEGMLRALSELVTREMIVEEALYPEARFRFRHPLTREVAYDMQLASSRTATHAAVGRALESDESTDPAVLAHHFEQGGEALAAARWHARAAQVAGVMDARAFRHWERVRALAASLPDLPEAIQLQLAATWGALELSGLTGMTTEEARALFESGRALAERARDRAALARLHAAYGTRLGWSGDLRATREQLALATSFADGVADLGVQLSVLVRTYVAEFHAGGTRQALEVIERGLDLVESERPSAAAEKSEVGDRFRSLVLAKAIVLQLIGRLDESEACIVRYAALAKRAGADAAGARNRHTFALARCALCWERGDATGCLREALEFSELAERSGSDWAKPMSLMWLGRAQVLAGNGVEARDVLRRCVASARELSLALEAEGQQLAALAQAELLCGEPEAARATASESVSASRQRETRVWEIYGHLALASAELASGHVDSAAAAVERADVLVDETGAESARPAVLVARAEVARVTGDAQGAESTIAQARELYGAHGAHEHVRRLARGS